MPDNLLNIDTDLSEILSKKLKHHEEQYKYHGEQVAYIKNFLKNAPVSANGHSINATTSINENFTKIWFWKKNGEKFINNNFPSEKFTTGNLVDKVVATGEDKDLRKKIIYAASITLGNLVKENKLKSKKEDGLRGFKYYL